MLLIGGVCGSIFGGIIAVKGRRRAIFILSTTLIADWYILCIFDFFCLIFGRFLLGMLIGSFSVISPLYVREIAPKSIAGSIGMLNQGMACAGAMTAYIIAFIVPFNEDENSYTSNSWQYVL